MEKERINVLLCRKLRDGGMGYANSYQNFPKNNASVITTASTAFRNTAIFNK